MKKLFILLVMALTLIACNPEPITNYKGAIVYEKVNVTVIDLNTGQPKEINYYFTILVDNSFFVNEKSFKEVKILEHDYNTYTVGDTIK